MGLLDLELVYGGMSRAAPLRMQNVQLCRSVVCDGLDEQYLSKCWRSRTHAGRELTRTNSATVQQVR